MKARIEPGVMGPRIRACQLAGREALSALAVTFVRLGRDEFIRPDWRLQTEGTEAALRQLVVDAAA